jgi:type III secretory pathway component EscS
MFYAAVVAAVIIGVLIALNQRLKEIKKGEDEEAKKY